MLVRGNDLLKVGKKLTETHKSWGFYMYMQKRSTKSRFKKCFLKAISSGSSNQLCK